ncbi:MAG: N-terminal cleavage protein [Gracilibacter sp. BRH_c7a]|nr:MAG: N-terminal cleavage protein [Gracilibacter sp. BRH_c7a]
MSNRGYGFTLIEVMLVVVILSVLAAIAVPRLAASADVAREKADITTGREVKAALDRYQIEKGTYPEIEEISPSNGEITGEGFIPDYIKILDSTITQQITEEANKGFGIAEIDQGESFPEPTNLIMIFLTTDGTAAEVRVYNKSLTEILWSSD